jgi:tripartite-type tricarboxylate transporter receptor subunit TctC
MRRRHVVAGLVAGIAASMFSTLADPARGQTGTDYPNRPVRMIVPYAAGGGTDFIARGLAEKLSQQTGQQFVIEYRGGAAGALGAEAVVKSTPDGYTLLLTPQAPIQLLPHLRKLPYDPLKDLIPVGRMAEQIAGFAVHPSVGVKTMTEFVALAKQHPGKYSFGTAGVGSVNHLRVETLKLMAGINLLHVPYKGVGEAMPDLLGGVIHLMVDSIVLPAAKAGKIDLIAVLTPERYAEFPAVGTMREQGFPDYDVPVWFGTYAPAGVPQPILDKLHREIATIHADAEFQAKQFAGGTVVYKEALSLPQLQERIAKDSARFADLIRRANIKLD